MSRITRLNLVMGTLFLIGVSFVAGAFSVDEEGIYQDGYKAAERHSTQAQQGASAFSGMDVWNALNDYRTKNGLNTLQLDERLCNNISGRARDLDKEGLRRGTWSHDGMDAFIDKQVEDELWPESYRYDTLEMIAAGDSANEVIEKWAGSPSHWQGLNSNSTIGCTYAWEGKALLFLR